MRNGLAIVALIFAVASVASAQKVQTAEVISAAGAFQGQEYRNSVLGLSMLAPGGWSFYDAKRNQTAVERIRQLAAKAGDAKLQVSAANTQVLFQAIPPADRGQDKQAILSAGIERLTTPTTPEKYVREQKALALASGNVRLTNDISRVTYGGVSFSSYDVQGDTERGTYRQRCIITLRGGVALFFVATFFDDRQEQIVDASLKSIRFNK
jgi:hypothetical protein